MKFRNDTAIDKLSNTISKVNRTTTLATESLS